MAQAFEKRNYLRLPVNLHVDYEKLEEETVFPRIATVTDISPAGIFIETQEPFALGDNLSIQIQLPGEEEKISLVGIVRWWKEAGTGANRPSSQSGMGVEILSISDSERARLLQYLGYEPESFIM